MDGNSDSDPKSALLLKDDWSLGGGWRRRQLHRHNSVNTLRNEFVLKLPDKVRSVLDLESFDVDFSRTVGLGKGLILFILYVWL